MESIDMFFKEVPNSLNSPESKHLLEINEYYIQMDEHRIRVFNSVTEKLLYVTKIAQPEI